MLSKNILLGGIGVTALMCAIATPAAARGSHGHSAHPAASTADAGPAERHVASAHHKRRHHRRHLDAPDADPRGASDDEDEDEES